MFIFYTELLNVTLIILPNLFTVMVLKKRHAPFVYLVNIKL